MQRPDSDEARLSRVVGLLSSAGVRVSIASLQGLIEDWRRIARQVSEGYSLTIYDYANDLDRRSALQLLMDVSPEVRNVLSRFVNEADASFREATVAISRPVRHLDPADRAGWWYWRIPKLPGDELRTDLASEGLVSDDSSNVD